MGYWLERGFQPTPPQMEIGRALQTNRGVIVVKGRRLGFTTYAMVQAIQTMLAYPNKSTLWGDMEFKSVRDYINKIAIPYLRHYRVPFHMSRQDGKLMFKNGSSITFRTRQNESNWEGQNYNFVILNEAGNLLERPDNTLLNVTVMPMLIDDPNSRLLVGGVPRGGTSSGYYRLYKQAVDDKTGYWKVLKFSTYDNPLLEGNVNMLADNMDEYSVRQEIYGEFTTINNRPFIHTFDESKHTHELTYKGGLIALSFDFNVDPITCIVCAADADKPVVVLDEFKLRNSDIYALCDAIVAKGYLPEKIAMITGDATGQNRSALSKGGLTYYDIILDKLGHKRHNIRRGILRLSRANPSVANSRALMNDVFRRGDIMIDSRYCQGLIEDVKIVQADEWGGMVKTDPNRTHLLDCLRYYVHAQVGFRI